ncbi:hypothetical protein [Nostoc sp.]
MLFSVKPLVWKSAAVLRSLKGLDSTGLESDAEGAERFQELAASYALC